jgi:hypothetical protein
MVRRAALAPVLQVQWGLSPSGPFTNSVIGYARAYIQVSLH